MRATVQGTTPSRALSIRGLAFRARRSVAAASAVLAVSATIVIASPSTPADAVGYPGQDEIEAAQAAVSDAQSGVAELDNAMAGLEAALNEADTAAMVAENNVTDAQVAKDDADAELEDAKEKSAKADAALAAARDNLATVAMDAYRTGGGMNELTAITSSSGFDDVIAKSEAVERSSSEADSRIQTVKAAEIVSSTMRTYAEEAATKAAEAQQAAIDAAATAEESRKQAQRAVDQVASARTEAINRLVSLRNSSVALEQQRQDGLAEERQANARKALEAKAAADAEAANDAEQTSNVRPNPVPRPTDSATTDNSSKPTSTSAPKPTATKDPAPAETKDPTPAETKDPAPAETKDPTPVETKDPAPAPAPDPDPTWSSSASQGRTALAHALTLQGKPYSQTKDGGVGPTYYDCSGLTQKSWAAAGVYIPRTSSSQYYATTKIPFSQARPGDLIFWSSNGSGSGIYHVEVYMGGNQVMGAHKPGTPAQINSLAYRMYNLMPVVGRP
ncbi:C40 family peptidase [Demequina aurantiaca]|uniref:C40 family peptidase n=1 Tax=Demequina aurantiaca TaxID=676200 RepID=UPI000782CB85|nr:C40 family peptidase [Demequina aurantiaca]